MSNVPHVNLTKLTRHEFLERMRTGALRACIVPVGAIEQHAGHLAMEHDWRSVSGIAEDVATRLQPGVIVAPALMAGISEHHMNHPGTLSLRPGTFLAVLNDVVDSVVRAGFTNVLVLNGHGGNVKPCEGVWDQFLRLFQVNLHFLSYWDVLDKQDAEALLHGGSRMPEDLPGHAQEFETAIALAAFPDNVRTDHLTGQPAALAEADTGRALLERIVDQLSDCVKEMTEEQRIASIPPYHQKRTASVAGM